MNIKKPIIHFHSYTRFFQELAGHEIGSSKDLLGHELGSSKDMTGHELG